MESRLKIYIVALLFSTIYNVQAQIIDSPVTIGGTPLILEYEVEGSLLKTLDIDLTIDAAYANLSMYANGDLILDNIDVPTLGNHKLHALVKFQELGTQEIQIFAYGTSITVNSIATRDITDLDFPSFRDMAPDANLESVITLKYGGPTIADMDNDGDYDMLLNNHNFVAPKLYWNNGDGTVSLYPETIVQYDVHGSAAGDYDNDGDLDLLISQGGGNGTTPATPNFFRNDEGTYVNAKFDAGLTEGSRGRSARWIDMDLDGDLDLTLINAQGINSSTGAIHIFYDNQGDGTFEIRSVEGLESKIGERILVTDYNNDHIDDIILFWPLSVWRGNGDFTYTNVGQSALPLGINNLSHINGVTDIDIDNDGDLDLYLARGINYLSYSFPTLDFDANSGDLDIRTNGNAGTTGMDFTAEGDIVFSDFDYVYRLYDGGYRLYLGSDKTATSVLDLQDDINITQAEAEGWPEERSENGIYIGYLGDGQWKMEWVRDQNVYWLISYTIKGLTDYTTTWAPLNRNTQDVLLRNDGGVYTDVSEEWKIPKGGKHMGVTTGDYNNDGHNDLFIYRWGYIQSRVADYLLLNDGQGGFETSTVHGADDPNDTGHGDMGQAFDFDLDGNIEMLNGSEEEGKWYLYTNENPGSGNFTTVNVGYGPESDIDPISAEVTVYTPSQSFFKRVGSAGASHSSSLLNIVHFGLGEEDQIDSIHVRWRNGEVSTLATDLVVNEVIDTDNVSPVSIAISPAVDSVRLNTTIPLLVNIFPINANMDVMWSSSNPSAASVDDNGVVTGHVVGETVEITATTMVGGLVASASVTVVAWFPIFVTAIEVTPETKNMLQGEIAQLTASIEPIDADDLSVLWTSSDESIATVDANGLVTAVGFGQVTITATTVDGNYQDFSTLTIEELILGFVEFDDESLYLNTVYQTDGSLEVTSNYHAGTGNTVVAGSFGGIKYWLRELEPDFSVVNNYAVSDVTPVGTTSGSSSVSIELADVTPTAELADDNFYFLWITMYTSAAETHQVSLVNINIEGVSTTDQSAVDDLKVFPIPTSDYIQFSGLKDQPHQVQIYNLEGHFIVQNNLKSSEALNVQNLPSGAYIMRIFGDNVNRSFRIIKVD